MKAAALLLITIASHFLFAADLSKKEIVPLIKAQKAVLVDVREPDEIKEGKIKGALEFATSKMNTPDWDKWTQSLPKDKNIYIYCRSGRRAERVAEALRSKGFKAQGAGGFEEWVQAGAESSK